MIDECSRESNQEIEKSGRKKKDAEAVLSVFKEHRRPMTAREAFKHLIGDEPWSGLNGVRSRITELTDAGYLRKTGRILEFDASFSRVNAWEWTGQEGPMPTEQRWEKCDRCCGRGKVPVSRPVDPSQGDLFKGCEMLPPSTIWNMRRREI